MDRSVSGIYQLEARTRLARPIFGDATRAGFPSPAEDYIEGMIDLNRALIIHPLQTYFARVEGDSMVDAGIPDGSFVAFDTHIESGDKDIVIASVNDDFCIKTLMESDERLWLEPANEAHPPIEITEDTDFRIVGCVTFVFHWVARVYVPGYRLVRCR